jgi:hypothetical protein
VDPYSVSVEPAALAALLTGLFEVAATHTLEVGDPSSIIEVVHVLLGGRALQGSHPSGVALRQRFRQRGASVTSISGTSI